MRNNTGIVNVPLLRLKERPLEEVQTVDEVLYGMEVLIREKTAKGSWAAVETAYGYQGYVKTEGLECHEWSIRKWQKLPKYVVCSPSADVYEMPGYQNPFLFTLPKGSIVAAAPGEGQAGWRLVRLIDGRGAYMRAAQIRPLPETHYSIKQEEEALRKSLVQTALSYLHTPYRWGGKTPWGIDCSGLCSMVYLLHGIYIYRDSKIKEGYPVKEILEFSDVQEEACVIISVMPRYEEQIKENLIKAGFREYCTVSALIDWMYREIWSLLYVLTQAMTISHDTGT